MLEFDEPWRLRGGASDGVDQREILCKQRVADDDARLCIKFRRERQRRFGQSLRPHVIRRRIDEVAAQGDSGGDAFDARAVNALRGAEPRLLVLGRLVAGKRIGGEQEGERRLRRRRDARAEAIKPRRQCGRELAGKKRIARLGFFSLGAEEDARRAIDVRRDQQRSGFRLEAGDRRQTPDRFGEPRAELGPVFLAHEVDRDRLWGPVFELHAEFNSFDGRPACLLLTLSSH